MLTHLILDNSPFLLLLVFFNPMVFAASLLSFDWLSQNETEFCPATEFFLFFHVALLQEEKKRDTFFFVGELQVDIVN